MSRNNSGTYSTPAGQPVVSGTTVASATFNTLVSDLATEMTDSLSRSGKGGMTAPIRTADGSVNAPAHAFTNETGTGIYRKGANNPALAVNEVERQEWTATGSTVTGTFEATGDGTVGGDLDVTGAATVGSLGVTGAAAVGGALDMNSNAINELADPTNAQDAATKAYVDAPTVSTASVTAGANWTLSGDSVVKAGGVVSGTLTATAAAGAVWTSIATLPVGYRPSVTITFVGTSWDNSGTARYLTLFVINTSGLVYASNYQPAGATVAAMYAIGASDKAELPVFSFIP